MKRPLQVGDRVAVYHGGRRLVGVLVDDSMTNRTWLSCRIDHPNGDSETFAVHPKQCRRLVKKERRRTTVEVQYDGRLKIIAHSGPLLGIGEQYNLVEVRRK